MRDQRKKAQREKALYGAQNLPLLGLPLLVLLLAAIFPAQAWAQEDAKDAGALAKVGISKTLRDVILPGSSLEVREIGLDTEVIVRIAASYPHGGQTRYDLVWYGLEPGRFDLGDYLQRSDGSSSDDLPPIPVQVQSILEAGRLRPNPVSGKAIPKVGGYQTWLIIGGLAWAFGLWVLFYFGRQIGAKEAGPEKAENLADRLRPLVQSAVAGTLSEHELAELELKLISLWRRRLGLTKESAPTALGILRNHDQAGPLLSGLEEWLHRPGPPQGVNIEELLLPYSKISSSEFLDDAGQV